MLRLRFPSFRRSRKKTGNQLRNHWCRYRVAQIDTGIPTEERKMDTLIMICILRNSLGKKQIIQMKGSQNYNRSFSLAAEILV